VEDYYDGLRTRRLNGRDGGIGGIGIWQQEANSFCSSSGSGGFVVVVGVVADKECGGNRPDWRRQMAFHDPHTSKAISGGSGVGGGGGGVTLK